MAKWDRYLRSNSQKHKTYINVHQYKKNKKITENKLEKRGDKSIFEVWFSVFI